MWTCRCTNESLAEELLKTGPTSSQRAQDPANRGYDGTGEGGPGDVVEGTPGAGQDCGDTPGPERGGRLGRMQVLLIALGGAAGALARYAVGRAAGPEAVPWATLGINLAGSLAIGVVLGAAAEDRLGGLGVATLVTGFLGAFTTFSTFSWEALALLRDDRVGTAAAYVGASVVGGLLAAGAGLLAIRSLLR